MPATPPSRLAVVRRVTAGVGRRGHEVPAESVVLGLRADNEIVVVALGFQPSKADLLNVHVDAQGGAVRITGTVAWREDAPQGRRTLNLDIAGGWHLVAEASLARSPGHRLVDSDVGL